MDTIKNDMSPGTENRMRVGTTLIQNLSRTFYPNTTMIFEELVTNARDAMAKNVKIFLGNDSIIVEDDGEGMSPSQLEKFFYISYSEKPMVPVKTLKDLKRQVIGRFGIGKLSLYQICESFTIESWRDRILSRSTFDFTEFEKNKFIDDFNLKVESSPATKIKSGTRIILEKLRQEKVPSHQTLIERLSKSMPLERFKVAISKDGWPNPWILKTRKLPAGFEYEIDTTKDEWKKFHNPEVGKIAGRIIYKPTEKEGSGDYGVHIRVLGRIVNTDNPHGTINFSSLTHARQFARRIYADLSADGLVDALMTNRAGILTDDKKFIKFQECLKNILNYLSEKEYKKWLAFKFKEEEEEIQTEVTGIIKDMQNDPKLASLLGSFSNIELQLDDKPKVSDPVIWKGKTKMAINSAHPLYSSARKIGKVDGIRFYAYLITLVEVSLNLAKNLKDFKRIFYSMIAGEPTEYKRKGGKNTREMSKVQ